MTLFAFQTGHNPRTRSRAYALETGFPARLQPELIERYLQNSRYWHKFICQLEDQYDVVITDCSSQTNRESMHFQNGSKIRTQEMTVTIGWTTKMDSEESMFQRV